MNSATIQQKTTDPLLDTFAQLEKAEALRLRGQSDKAGAICEKLVGRYPNYFGALYTLGLIYVDRERYPQALGCLVRAAMLNPRSWRALTALSAVYLELGASEMAAHTLEQASAINQNDPNILMTLGEIYYEEREYELARDAYRRSFELDPSLDVAAIGQGMCHSHLGEYAESAAIFESLIKRGLPSLGTFFELNNLPSSFVSVDLLAGLKHLKRDKKQPVAEFETSLAFVSAAALDKKQRHTEAWERLVQANATMFKEVGPKAKELSETQRLNLIQLQKHPGKIKTQAYNPNHPISLFILGPSRSGKTTIESLVAGLNGVKRGYENPSVENAIRRTFQSAGLLTSSMFEVLPPKLDPECRGLYLEELSRRAGSAKVFTNTHPGRIHDVARIAAAFPNVRFLLVKRDIHDNMLRIFMRKYRSGNVYAYDLDTIREHITWYHQMIDVLAEKLPGIVRVVQYEELVTDPASTLALAAELCGLQPGDQSPPLLGDDRNCAGPYQHWL